MLSADPRRPGIHYRIGRTLLARSRQSNTTEDVAAAAKEFAQELEVDPGNANAAYELGEIHRNAGEFDEAQKFFALAVQYHPDFEEAQLGLGAVLMSLQKPDLALPHLQKAVALSAGNEVAWYRLSQVQGMLGQEAEQKKTFAEFQRLRNQKSIQKRREKKSSPQRKSLPRNSIKARHSSIRRGRCPTGPGRATPGNVSKHMRALLPARTRASGPTWVELSLRGSWWHSLRAFLYRDQLVRCYVGQGLPLAIRPADLYFGAPSLAQPKMQAKIIAGQKARLTLHFLGLRRVCGLHDHPRANRAAIRFRPDQFHFEPGIISGDVIAKQRRGLVQIDHRMSRSPSLSKSPKAHPRLLCASCDRGPGLVGKLFERPVTQIAEQHPRVFRGKLGMPFLDLREKCVPQP